MNTKDFKRKLTAIFSADVAGYSRLMGEDESATVKTLEAYKEAMFSLIKQHRGRLIDSPGDNLLAEFASVVDAVQCGVAVQNELKARNADLPENRRMQFRIGINLGDVIEEGERIYGDGVNIAARLEGCADPGGICVSRTAFDHIETKLPLGYEYLGEQTVKNIARPVGAYKVLMEPRITVAGAKERKIPVPVWKRKSVLAGAVAVLVLIIGAGAWNFYFGKPTIEPASVEKMAFPLPDKPSVAVLPFTNLSGDPEQDFLVDGITENIITVLSGIPHLFVIARNSTFAYKGKPVRVQQVSEELGVRYVLEGSVARSGDRIRVTAQLIDAIKGHHLWSERYDRELKDLFTLQDDLAKKILSGVGLKLTRGEDILHIAFAKNIEVNLKLFQGTEYLRAFNIDGNNRARLIAEECIALEPDYWGNYFLLGCVHMMDYYLGSTKDPAKSLRTAIEYLEQAVAMSEDSKGRVYTVLGNLYAMKKNYAKAIELGEEAITIVPNGADAHAWLAMSLTFAGRAQEALPLFEKAMRLNPLPPAFYYLNFGSAYRLLGRFEEAVSMYKKTIALTPNNIFAYISLTGTYGLMGKTEEAGAAGAEILRINPKWSIEYYTKTSVFKDSEELAEVFRKVGLPEKPPLPLPDKPSIAVLPFGNMSEDPQQEYFSDGISEDIITDLSKISGLIVIARNSSFAYKGKAVNIQQIGQDLRVRYLLEGSVRKAGDKVRINAQLIDASSGHHLWADRYDGDMSDIFALQDNITRKIISALALKLTANEETAVTDRGTDNLQAYDSFLKGWQGYRMMTKEGFAEAKIHLGKAVELDPEFARAYAALAVLYWKAIQIASPELREGLGINNPAARNAVRNKPHFLLKKAMRNPTALAHGLMSQFYLFRYQHDEALSEIEQAVAMDPNDPELYAWMSHILWLIGKNKEAIESAKMGLRLDPNNPTAYLIQQAKAYLPDGNLEESLLLLERAKRLNPNLSGSIALTESIIYGIQGRDEEARIAYGLFVKSRHSPVRNLNDILLYIPFADPKKLDRIAASLIKAGVPGKPTDYYRIFKENRIDGQAVKEFLFGQKITGTAMSTGKQYWWEWDKNGKFKVDMQVFKDTGKSWVERDIFFIQFDKFLGGLPYGTVIYRNPDGSMESQNEYLIVSDTGSITPFAPID